MDPWRVAVDLGRRQDLERIFAAAVAAVDPRRLILGAVRPISGGFEIGSGPSRVVIPAASNVGVLGAGKAASAMAAGLGEAFSSTVALAGTVIVPASDAAVERDGIRRLRGDHPIPGPASMQSSRVLLRETERPQVEQFIFLMSGGASSLFALPLPPLRLADKQAVTHQLLLRGAAIDEINIVRKHLSAVKGGRLLRRMLGRRLITLILSDVVGDDPATVGSGPTVPDTTTYADAIAVLERHQLWSKCSRSVTATLRRGARGEIPETVREGDVEARGATAFVIGSNATAKAAAAAEAEKLGYAPSVRQAPLAGDTASCAAEWLAGLDASGGDDRPRCHIAGGETTVQVVGDGKGGRNQEFALALVEPLRDRSIALLSAGTDGVDGPTDAAGAFVDGRTWQRAHRFGLAPFTYLNRNDSYTFFNDLGDLFRPGPTGTNVMDLKIALTWPPSAR